MSELREIAKANGIKSVTTMRKESLIDKIIELSDGKMAGASSTTSTTRLGRLLRASN